VTAAAALVIVLTAVLSWVITDTDRTARLVHIIRALRERPR
jgi:hypothetical protein